MGQIADILKRTGYKCFTFLDRDLDTSEIFGEVTIKSTFDIYYEKAKDDIDHLIELVLILNYKSWIWGEKAQVEKNETAGKYSKLYYVLQQKAEELVDSFSEDDRQKFYSMIN